MRNLAMISTLAALSVTGSAMAGRAMKEPPPANIVGIPVSCVPLNQLRESIVRNDRVIDFRSAGKKWYRNTLPHNCPSLGSEQRFSYRTSLSSLCSSDVITVLYQHSGGLSSGASCGLGKFQPVEIPKDVKR